MTPFEGYSDVRLTVRRCGYCGAKNTRTHKECWSCGKPIQIAPRRKRIELWKCPRCGTQNNTTNQNCWHCGLKNNA